MPAETRYAKSGEVHVAYQALGAGPLDLVYIPSAGHHVELNWENPPIARFLDRLATLCRLIVSTSAVRACPTASRAFRRWKRGWTTSGP